MVKKQQSNHSPLISTSTLIIISLLVGLVIGFSINLGNSQDTMLMEEEHDHSTHTHDVHSHDQIEVPLEYVPTISISVFEDSKSGYNLEIEVDNFEFVSTQSYETIEKEETITYGHAHLYINGEKITRLYSKSYYLGELEGHNEITVTLNSNEHENLAINGESIQATTILTVE